MLFQQNITLANGEQLIIRSLTTPDAGAAIFNMRKTAAETDFLLREPHECGMTIAQEEAFISRMQASPREVILGVFIGGALIGMANLAQSSPRERTRHRASVGVSLLRAHWGKGVGTALMSACAKLASEAGYEQLELEVVKSNVRAVRLYERLGFERIGCIPCAIKYRDGRYADLIMMALRLDNS